MRVAMGNAGRARWDFWLLVRRVDPDARLSGRGLLPNDDAHLVLDVAYSEGEP